MTKNSRRWPRRRDAEASSSALSPPGPEGLRELGKKFNLLKGRDFRASVRRIQRHNIMVVGSFIIGLDVDQPGIGGRIAEVASQYGMDNLNVLFLTPLPGTRLWDQMNADNRIALSAFPENWNYYTLTYPVADTGIYLWTPSSRKLISCNRKFYSMPRVLRRVCSNLWHRRAPLISFVGNLSYRSNIRVDCKAYADFKSQWGSRFS